MTLRRSLLPAIALAIAAMTGASAQMAPAGKPPCWDDFSPLRDEAQKRANAVRVAQERKASLPEACQLITRFIEAEARVVKFAQDNGVWCGIPAEALKQMKDSHGKSNELRKRVCGAAAAPPRPAGPSLSDSLGTTRVPDASKAKTGTGTFDTLTGSALAR
jgi:hypothetical protein